MVKGRFGRLAAEATARGDHGARAKEITKQRVLESYAAAKAQRKDARGRRAQQGVVPRTLGGGPTFVEPGAGRTML